MPFHDQVCGQQVTARVPFVLGYIIDSTAASTAVRHIGPGVPARNVVISASRGAARARRCLPRSRPHIARDLWMSIMDDRHKNVGWRSGERARAAVFSAAVLAAVLSPLLQYRRPISERVDGFPLSWYPMFSAKRRRQMSVIHAVGITADGGRLSLPPRALGTGGVNQVRRQLYRVAVREARPDAYAGDLAARVARSPDWANVIRVEVVRTLFDLDDCLTSRRVDGESTVLASAAVRP
jgi:hypothetical protein